MVKWEYDIRTVPEGKVFIGDLNTLGARGWELVSILPERELWLIFKRPLVRCLKEYVQDYDAAIEGITSFKDGDCNCSTCQEGDN